MAENVFFKVCKQVIKSLADGIAFQVEFCTIASPGNIYRREGVG
jgi:hypothetical protein